MERWTEIRSAYLVAKLGTVSAAARALNLHRATINRHIDVLEAIYSTKLFQRHARGFTPTDAGRDLLETVSRVDDMFADLSGRINGRSSQLSGELVITALSGTAPLIMPAIRDFRAAHPDVEVQFVADSRLARLEYGEAHVALRAGPKPEELDYVVLPFKKICFALYAHKTYLATHPQAISLESLQEQRDTHYFVGSLDISTPIPYKTWMKKYVPEDSLALNTEHPIAILSGVAAGLGIGFLPEYEAVQHPDLVQVVPSRSEWSANLWITTHVDLHRTAKVQAFIRLLKSLA